MARGGAPPGVSAVIPNTLTFCDNFLSVVNFEALLLLNGSRWSHRPTNCDWNVVPEKAF